MNNFSFFKLNHFYAIALKSIFQFKRSSDKKSNSSKLCRLVLTNFIILKKSVSLIYCEFWFQSLWNHYYLAAVPGNTKALGSSL